MGVEVQGVTGPGVVVEGGVLIRRGVVDHGDERGLRIRGTIGVRIVADQVVHRIFAPGRPQDGPQQQPRVVQIVGQLREIDPAPPLERIRRQQTCPPSGDRQDLGIVLGRIDEAHPAAEIRPVEPVRGDEMRLRQPAAAVPPPCSSGPISFCTPSTSSSWK